MLIPSGIAPLDYEIGGLMPGRVHLLSGGPGTGKSLSCLEFLNVSLERGEPAALLTHDDPADVLSSGAFLGIDLDTAIRHQRLMLIRYRPGFGKLLSRAPRIEVVLQELEPLLGERPPVRLAVDSLVPFLESGEVPAVESLLGLTQLIEQLRPTSLLTYPADLAGPYDKRMDAVVQRAAGIFHLSTVKDGRHQGQLEVRKLRYQARSLRASRFRIVAGSGFVVVHESGTSPADEIRRQLLVLNLAESFPEGLLQLLERDHSVLVRAGRTSAPSNEALIGVGALLLNVRRDVIADAIQLIREIRRAENAIPIVVVTPYVLRSGDRTRALRAGADDFLSTNLPPDELIARIDAIACRRRSGNAPAEEPQPPVFLQPSRDGGSYILLDAAGFRRAVGVHLSRERAPFFVVARAHPVNGDVMSLADLALRMSRVDSGDLVGFEGGSVLVYLDGARPKELKSYLGRLHDEWRRVASDEMAVETFGFPADETWVRDFAGAPPAP